MKFIKLILLLSLISSLNSCGPFSYKKTDARKFPADPALRVKKNMEDGKGFKLFDSERKVGQKVNHLKFLAKKGWVELQLMSLLVQTNFGVQL